MSSAADRGYKESKIHGHQVQGIPVKEIERNKRLISIQAILVRSAVTHHIVARGFLLVAGKPGVNGTDD